MIRQYIRIRDQAIFYDQAINHAQGIYYVLYIIYYEPQSMGAWRREGGSAPKGMGFGGPVERTDDLHLLRKSRPGSCEWATSEAMGRSEPPMASAARRRTMNGVATGARAGVPGALRGQLGV